MTHPTGLLTQKEASEYLQGRSRNSLYLDWKSGRLQRTMIGKRIYYSIEDLNRFLEICSLEAA